MDPRLPCQSASISQHSLLRAFDNFLTTVPNGSRIVRWNTTDGQVLMRDDLRIIWGAAVQEDTLTRSSPSCLKPSFNNCVLERTEEARLGLSLQEEAIRSKAS